METGSWKRAPFIPYPKAGWRPGEGEGDERVENKGFMRLLKSRTHFGRSGPLSYPQARFSPNLGLGPPPSKPKCSLDAKFAFRLERPKERLSLLPISSATQKCTFHPSNNSRRLPRRPADRTSVSDANS